MSTLQETFNFRRIAKADFDASIADSPVPENFLADNFDTITEGDKVFYRRKSVTLPITLPDALDALPDDIRDAVKEVVKSALAGYIKSTYIDEFAEVGEYSINDVFAQIQKRGGRTSWEFSEDDLKFAHNSFGKYMAAKTSSLPLGELLAGVAKRHFTEKAIASQIKKYNEDTLVKLRGHLQGWSEYLAQDDNADVTDGVTNLFFKWDAALERQLKQLTTNVADLL